MLRASTSTAVPRTRPPARKLNWRRLRFFPLAIGALALALGLWTGLTRSGVRLPGGVPSLAEFHGALMISGFLGTLISLERAVALARSWAYAAPLLSSIGAIALMAGMPRLAAAAFAAAGGILLLGSTSIAIRQVALFTVALVIGAACWTAGTLQWLLGDFTPVVVGWWLNFLVLTIAAERLELSRIVSPPSSSRVTFVAVVALLLLGSGRGELVDTWAPFTGTGLLGCAVWLFHYDIARRTVRIAEQPRFSALSILAGHFWLGVAGLLLLLAPRGGTAFSYDAAVHAITIGFGLSMVLGHAPIIFPAVTGIRIPFTRYAYVSLALLHISVVLRITGDVFAQMDLRRASGIVTVFALAGYVVTLVLASRARSQSRAG